MTSFQLNHPSNFADLTELDAKYQKIKLDCCFFSRISYTNTFYVLVLNFHFYLYFFFNFQYIKYQKKYTQNKYYKTFCMSLCLLFLLMFVACTVHCSFT